MVGNEITKDRSLDYFGQLKKAFEIVRYHKYLWFLGMLAGGASSFNGGGGGSGSSPSSDSSDNAQQVFGAIGTWIQQNIMLIVVLGIILFLVMVFFTIISLMARGGLVGAVDKIDKGEESSFMSAMGLGWHKAWRLFGMGWLFFLIFMIVFLPLVAVFVALGFLQLWIPFIILIIPAILGIIFFSVVVGIVSEYALRFATIEDIKAVESIKRGYRLLKGNKKESSLIFLVLMLVGMGGGLAMIATIVVIAIPLVLIGVLIAILSMMAMVIYATLAVICFLGVIFLLGGFLSSLTSAYWTLCFKEIISWEDNSLIA